VEEVAKAIGMSSSFYNTFEKKILLNYTFKIAETLKT
jgi:hypothetical protein